MRSGELHEAAAFLVPDDFMNAARRLGLAASLAVTIIAERTLVLADLHCREADHLDDAAASGRASVPLSARNATYARMLFAALNGGLPARQGASEVLVVPTRLADRISAAQEMQFTPRLLRPALRWELAAVRAGRTMTEWALLEVLSVDRYPLAVERQSVAARIAAR